MRKNLYAARVTAVWLGGAVLAAGGQAAAATPTCTSLNLANPLFISGSTAVQAALQAVAKALPSVNIVYLNPDSCLGVADLVAGQASTEAGFTPKVLNSDGTTTQCVLDSPTPQTNDIAVSDVFPATCGLTSLTNIGPSSNLTLTEVLGPAQAIDFAVPATSNATSISAEAAYVVFGADATTYVIPQWNVPGAIFTRPQTSGTLNMAASAISLDPAKWANATTGSSSPQQKAGTGGIITALATATSNQNATISTVSDEGLIQYNTTPAGDAGLPPQIKPIAYQHKGQKCGYFPSSKQSTFDKINVRQGRYAVWGPVHFLVPVDGGGHPIGPHAAAATLVLDYFIATGPNPTTPLLTVGDAGAPTITDGDKKSMIEAEANPGYVVPWCAMEVKITSEIGQPAAYASPTPCACDFETKVGAVSGGKTLEGQTCTPCTDNTPCSGSTPTCRYGFCEAR